MVRARDEAGWTYLFFVPECDLPCLGVHSGLWGAT